MRKLIPILLLFTLLIVACTAEPTEFPTLGNTEVIEWSLALDLLHDGQVTQVIQTHNLDVYLTLADGREVRTVEPAIDDIFDEIQACGDPCANIILATE